jgi:hypothetical protein
MRHCDGTYLQFQLFRRLRQDDHLSPRILDQPRQHGDSLPGKKIVSSHPSQNNYHQKNKKNNKFWRECRKKGNSNTFGRNANLYNHYREQTRVLSKS